MSESDLEKRIERVCTWLVPRLPGFYVGAGLAAYWAACLAGSRIPYETLFVGPIMMLVGLILSKRVS